MNFRTANSKDLIKIVQLLADDNLGATRETFQDPLPQEYIEAFERIEADKNQELVVVESSEEIVGTMQLSFLQYLTYNGGLRAQIEAVRIRKDKRATGLGKKMMEWAISHAKEKGAHVLQLTTDKQRPEAILFYKKLGFVASHEGMKLHL